ncbi:phosphoribosyltransferase [Aliarcobacter butzleri]|uniref:phosphoribosyltransferase n=1 Tax=Aliarcobacter butzleri TaxID=28197 RepID=UPI00125FEB4F|nr:phosphoribosyltransferase family protein [Aliarcobacter butzleri]MCT7562192.1 phosphoribosyltransferase domain-containing protein [Aliarcobacter butzleri]MCT7627033.1 phosphoribosyltransferase domain-containing protein [Aliarcobacter butzleri]UWY61000.1 phosphoribosyltransferase domain-containing protein [Aliarcobacter butzleri]
MEKLYYSYEIFKDDTQALVDKCRDFNPEVLLAIARGGLTLSHLMAQALDIRNLFTINCVSYDKDKQISAPNIFNIPDLTDTKKVLIIDDIVDSGKTMKEIIKILKEKFPKVEFKLATIFYKKTAVIKPDYYVKNADVWIDFFWEVDVK